MSTRSAASPRCRFDLDGSGGLAELERLLGRGRREEVHGARNDPGPASLVTGAEAGAIVAVEILVEEEIVAPMRIFLELPGSAVDRSIPVLVSEEDARKPSCNLLRHLIESSLTS